MNPSNFRIGIGHDTHRVGEGGPMILGGITIEHDKHLIGHSDADVLLHAVTDAILGASGNGDIGELFPDTADENKARDSAEMLSAAKDLAQKDGFEIVNLDCIVFAQRPKLTPYKAAIGQRIAEILNIEPDRVGIKAKTGENVGPVGKETALMAECVLSLIHI